MDNYALIKSLLEEKVKHPEKIEPQARIKDLGIDSLDLVDLMLEAEERLGITLNDDDLMNIDTVQDAVSLLDEKTSHRS